MAQSVTMLMQSETVRVDPDQLGALYEELGEAGAEDVICRAMEELAVRLTLINRLYRENKMRELRKNTRSLIAIADQVGMAALARVAGDVVCCVDEGDAVALGATLARLIRIGERSLTAVWDIQDLSI